MFLGMKVKTMAVLWREVRFAIRALRKSPGFTAVAILTLALGIGPNTAIFSVVQGVLLRPLPFVHPENLVQIWNTYSLLPAFPQVELSPGDFVDFKKRATSFSDMAAYVNIPQGFNLTGQGEAERIEARYANSGFFELLGIQPIAGRAFSAEEDRHGATPSVMLTHRLWQSRFGSNPAIVGRTLILDGRGYVVAGILPATFRLASTTDLWLPVGLYPDDLTSHIHHEFSVLARLKPGMSVAQAQAEIATLNRQEETAFPDTHKNWGVLVKPMEDASAAKLRVALIVLFAAVGLVLLIACANIVNLLLARNAARQKEIALRIALGATRSRLMGQLLTESVVLSLLGGVIGLFLASAGLEVLKAVVPSDMSVVKETGLNGWVLAFTLAVCFLAGLACGLAPALQVLKRDLHGVLKEGGRTLAASGGQRLRSALVVSEIALALIPLVGAGLLIRSFYRVLEVDPGFRAEHILVMEVDQAQLPFAELAKLTPEQSAELVRKQSSQFEQIAQRIEALPGVKAVGGVNVLPLGSQIRSASRFVLEGQPAWESGARPLAEVRVASLRYLAAMGIPQRAGRLLDEHDYGQQTIVINEAMAWRFWNGDAIGKRINLCSLDPTPCWTTIVGVIGNVHQYGLDAAPSFDVYFTGGWTPYFVIRTSADPAAQAHAAIEQIHKGDPTLPVTRVTTLDSLVAESVSPRRFSMSLMGVFAALALVLAAVGIYGVMSYVVSLRTSEIGIRVALGARPRDIWRLVLRRGAGLTLMGVAIGAAGALALTKLLSSLLYAVKPTDPVTFAGVAILLSAIGVLACYVPARRAMRVDPMVALRHE
jgi:putative ABC transport system permease protein